MKLTVLVDNNTYIDRYYYGEPAVSYYLEDEDIKLLFDVGYSDIYLKNALAMGIDLSGIDKIAISHGHNDHTRGLLFLPEFKHDVQIVAHPDTFKHKIYQGEDIGSPLSFDELKEKYTLRLSKEAIKLSNNITYLGEIPISQDFEQRYAIGECLSEDGYRKDTMLDDSAIVYKCDKGLFVITGCSHSGICNIIEYAKKVCCDKRIYGVIGGFHLFENDDRLQATIDYLDKNKIELLYPCHCVSLEAKIAMANKLKINEVGVGLVLEI